MHKSREDPIAGLYARFTELFKYIADPIKTISHVMVFMTVSKKSVRMAVDGFVLVF